MKVLLCLLLFALLANADYCPCVTTTCAMSTQCYSASVIATPPFNALIQPVISVLDVRMLPSSNLEACNLRQFCIDNPPGNYCYVPSGNRQGGNCKCLPAAFVQCPFGVLNVCQRGYGCLNAPNDSGMMTASCTRFLTLTSATLSTITTSLSHSTFVATTLLSINSSSTRVLISQPAYGTTQLVPTTLILSSAHSTALKTSVLVSTNYLYKVSTSRPYTFASIPPFYISVTSCGGTIVGTATTTLLPPVWPLSAFQSSLCFPILPNSASYLPRITRVVIPCPVTVSLGATGHSATSSGNTSSSTRTVTSTSSNLTSSASTNSNLTSSFSTSASASASSNLTSSFSIGNNVTSIASTSTSASTSSNVTSSSSTGSNLTSNASTSNASTSTGASTGSSASNNATTSSNVTNSSVSTSNSATTSANASSGSSSSSTSNASSTNSTSSSSNASSNTATSSASNNASSSNTSTISTSIYSRTSTSSATSSSSANNSTSTSTSSSSSSSTSSNNLTTSTGQTSHSSTTSNTNSSTTSASTNSSTGSSNSSTILQATTSNGSFVTTVNEIAVWTYAADWYPISDPIKQTLIAEAAFRWAPYTFYGGKKVETWAPARSSQTATKTSSSTSTSSSTHFHFPTVVTTLIAIPKTFSTSAQGTSTVQVTTTSTKTLHLSPLLYTHFKTFYPISYTSGAAAVSSIWFMPWAVTGPYGITTVTEFAYITSIPKQRLIGFTPVVSTIYSIVPFGTDIATYETTISRTPFFTSYSTPPPIRHRNFFDVFTTSHPPRVPITFFPTSTIETFVTTWQTTTTSTYEVPFLSTFLAPPFVTTSTPSVKVGTNTKHTTTTSTPPPIKVTVTTSSVVTATNTASTLIVRYK